MLYICFRNIYLLWERFFLVVIQNCQKLCLISEVYFFFLYWHVIDVVLGFVNRIFICFQHSNIITCTSKYISDQLLLLPWVFAPHEDWRQHHTIQQNPQYRIKLGLTIPSSFLFSASHAVVVTGNGR